MKALILAIAMIATTTLNAQIGNEIGPTLPETIYIQYLVKKAEHVELINTVQIKAELEVQNITEYEYEFKYYQYGEFNEKIKYVIACKGPNRLNILAHVRKFYHDAYYIDENGARTQH